MRVEANLPLFQIEIKILSSSFESKKTKKHFIITNWILSNSNKLMEMIIFYTNGGYKLAYTPERGETSTRPLLHVGRG
jgi:hypothetical protein